MSGNQEIIGELFKIHDGARAAMERDAEELKKYFGLDQTPGDLARGDNLCLLKLGYEIPLNIYRGFAGADVAINRMVLDEGSDIVGHLKEIFGSWLWSRTPNRALSEPYKALEESGEELRKKFNNQPGIIIPLRHSNALEEMVTPDGIMSVSSDRLDFLRRRAGHTKTDPLIEQLQVHGEGVAAILRDLGISLLRIDVQAEYYRIFSIDGRGGVLAPEAVLRTLGVDPQHVQIRGTVPDAREMFGGFSLKIAHLE